MNTSLTLSQLHTIHQLSGDASLLAKKTNDIIFRKKIKDLDAEDIRLLIGQELLLETIVPLALEILRNDPMAEGDFYPGDLLKNTMEIPENYWGKHPDQKDMLSNILLDHRGMILKQALSGAIRMQLQDLMESFIKH